LRVDRRTSASRSAAFDATVETPGTVRFATVPLSGSWRSSGPGYNQSGCEPGPRSSRYNSRTACSRRAVSSGRCGVRRRSRTALPSPSPQPRASQMSGTRPRH
jgi:hypothetical protein